MTAFGCAQEGGGTADSLRFARRVARASTSATGPVATEGESESSSCTVLGLHVRGALNNGCTLAEIREVLLQTAVYCGIPAGKALCHDARPHDRRRKKQRADSLGG